VVPRSSRAIRRGLIQSRKNPVVRNDQLLGAAAQLIDVIWATPPTSNAGRAAKVRVFLTNIANSGLPGSDPDLDWDVRRLVLEYAGMTEADAVKFTRNA
jgi:hypothetical protein